MMPGIVSNAQYREIRTATASNDLESVIEEKLGFTAELFLKSRFRRSNA